ncbi:MAG: TlpA family protein disulfide reductase [Gammaproteobacteria bacterium]|nr:MAG: TlpA family protein disulfide reductase [Gammaproteobacteria bacterium]
MNRRSLTLGGFFVLLLLGALAYLWSTSAARAPELQLSLLDGSPMPLAALQGKPVLVTFWATTCTTCVSEMPHLVELYRELKPRGFEILAVAMPYDPPADVAALVRARQLPYLIALDHDGSATRAFGDVRITPTSFLLSPDGAIVRRAQGRMDMAELRAQILSLLPAPPLARL